MIAQKTTLRAQWNSREGCWRIVKKTDNGCGGWKLFGEAESYAIKSEAELKIKELIEIFPDQYQAG